LLEEAGGHDAVFAELIAQECVRHEHVTNDVNKVQAVRKQNAHAPAVVGPPSFHQVAGQLLLLALPLLVVQHPLVQAYDDQLDLARFRVLVDNVGHVEYHGLKEKNEGNPLVVELAVDLVCGRIIRAHACLAHHVAQLYKPQTVAYENRSCLALRL